MNSLEPSGADDPQARREGKSPIPTSAEDVAHPTTRSGENAGPAAQSAKPEQPTSLVEALRVMEMQDKIIEALQRDNEGFLSEKRQLISRVKELDDALANLEAKHSLLLSAQSSVQDREKVSSPESEATVAKLKARINELEFEVQQLADANQAAKAELARHSNCATKLELAEAEIQNLHVSLRRKESEQQKSVEEMAERIRSFTEQGNYNAEMENRLREQEETIRQLKTQLSDATPSPKTKQSGSSAHAQEVHHLKRRIVDLEELLRQKSSESIADLIRSCQPSAQDSKVFKRQEAHIEQLKEALSVKDKFAEAAVERLRLESAQVRRQYEEKLLESETKLSKCQRSERDLQSTVRDLEKEVHRLRRDLASTSARVASAQTSEVTRDDKVDVAGLLEANATLRERVRALEASQTRPGATEHLPTLEALQALVRSLTDEVAAYKKLAEESERIARDSNDRAERRVLQWKQEMMTQMQTVREEHNREIDRLQRSHQSDLARALERHASTTDSIDDAARRWQPILDDQGQEGFLHAILARLNFLERRYQQKEKEFAYELAETRRSFELERSVEAQKYELALDRKNQQISDFRTQLDQLLSQVALLSAQTS